MPAQNTLNKHLLTLRRSLDKLDFAEPVTHLYNPAHYAWPMMRAYHQRFGSGPKRVVFLGMNPGPWGMAQTGVPFGEIAAVRDWLQLNQPIAKPEHEHPKRPITGLACPRSEVSGQRLWGLMQQRFTDANAFFAEHFVLNYCPLCFMGETGRNITPDKLPATEREPLFKACDAHLRRVIDTLQPQWVIGVGAFAEACTQRVLGDSVSIGRILHPSPASPLANRDWAGAATQQLIDLGVWT